MLEKELQFSYDFMSDHQRVIKLQFSVQAIMQYIIQF